MTANIVDVGQVPPLADMVAALAVQRGQPDPYVLSGLLAMLPTQCGGDGVLYHRQRAAEQAAEGYERALATLRPGARFYWRVVPDGRGWRWWGVLLPHKGAE